MENSLAAPLLDQLPQPLTQPEQPPEEEVTLPPSPAIQAFLRVYELLLNVFQHADNRTSAIAARSSRVLSEPALDVLWRVIPKPSYLFSVLGTLDGAPSYDGHSSRRFDYDRDLYPEDWERFLPYSRRVEEISCWDDCNSSERWNEPSHKAFAKISASRPPQLTLSDIFPRLRHVTWSVYSHKVLRHINLFLVPSLTLLEIKIDNVVEFKPMTAFLKQLRARSASTLKEFRLNTDFSVAIIEDDVIDTLKAMTNLERLILPRFWITERVFTTLANLSYLQYVGQRKAYWWGNIDDTESGLLPAIEALTADAFPTLQDLTYDTLNLNEAKRFLSHPFAPKHLTSLCVTSNRLEEPHRLQDFLTCLASSALQLKEVDIGLTFPITDAPGHSTDITVTTLRPLHSLPELTHFGLAAHFPVKMDDADLDIFTAGWTRLKVLWLNETPAHAVQRDVKSEMTLAALKIMAKNCPQLEELSLFIDASNIPEEPPAASTKFDADGSNNLAILQALAPGLHPDKTKSSPVFRHLRYLNLGVSHLTSPTSVANYITEMVDTEDPDASRTPPSSAPALQRPLPTDPPVGSGRGTPPFPPGPADVPPSKPRPFYFECSPRFWPAPIPVPELDHILTRRRDSWEDVGKMIPALMEQKARYAIIQRDFFKLLDRLSTLELVHGSQQ
ncbi:hypothetical protein FRB99_002019 [Tulasnella sp. 403]|nr:hypothetical protein FRB99_002019 [Tulasnella sp. 403]